MRRYLPLIMLVAGTILVIVLTAITGFGVGSGSREGGGARVLVTEDFGSRVVGARIVQELPGNETAMRLTQRSFDVETRYGGGFVQAIDGLEGSKDGQYDWFFYVNGILSDTGAADVDVHGGDSVWWDRHDWRAAQNIGAVVGQFPEPFAHGAEGKRYPVVLQCDQDAEDACSTVSQQLSDVGVLASRQTLGTNVETEVLRVLVGDWESLRRDQALRQLDRGPIVSGVFARFDADGRQLELLDEQGRTARTVGAGAGLVAATKLGEQVPTWAVTGTDLDGVAAAADALVTRRLKNRFALATDPAGNDVGLPLLR